MPSPSSPQPPRRRGRPRKFGAPSRAVTLTLPEHVLATLGRIDADLSRAVVRVVDRPGPAPAHRAAELAEFGRRAVIVVGPSRLLERRAGVDLIPLPDGRALISFDRARTTAEFELTLSDALADAELPPRDREVFEAVAAILRGARRSAELVLKERSIIVVETRRRRRARGPKP